MDEFTTADRVIASIAVGGLIIQFMIMVLSRRGHLAKMRADDADAYESLSATVASLSVQVKDLRRELDIEHRARELAERKVEGLRRKIEELEARYHRDVTRLEFENEALKEALEIWGEEEG